MYDELTGRYTFACPARGDGQVPLSRFRSSSACPGAAHPAVYQITFACSCGGEHDGLVTHDELDWAPLAGSDATFFNLMTARVESAADRPPRPGRAADPGRVTGPGASSATRRSARGRFLPPPFASSRRRPTSSGSPSAARSASARPSTSSAASTSMSRSTTTAAFGVVEHIFARDRDAWRSPPSGDELELRRVRRAAPRPGRVGEALQTGTRREHRAQQSTERERHERVMSWDRCVDEDRDVTTTVVVDRHGRSQRDARLGEPPSCGRSSRSRRRGGRPPSLDRDRASISARRASTGPSWGILAGAGVWPRALAAPRRLDEVGGPRSSARRLLPRIAADADRGSAGILVATQPTDGWTRAEPVAGWIRDSIGLGRVRRATSVLFQGVARASALGVVTARSRFDTTGPRERLRRPRDGRSPDEDVHDYRREDGRRRRAGPIDRTGRQPSRTASP